MVGDRCQLLGDSGHVIHRAGVESPRAGHPVHPGEAELIRARARLPSLGLTVQASPDRDYNMCEKRLTQLILELLELREMRVLALVVAVRHRLDRNEGIKRDLVETVSSLLQKMVASNELAEVGGTYTVWAPGLVKKR